MFDQHLFVTTSVLESVPIVGHFINRCFFFKIYLCCNFFLNRPYCFRFMDSDSLLLAYLCVMDLPRCLWPVLKKLSSLSGSKTILKTFNYHYSRKYVDLLYYLKKWFTVSCLFRVAMLLSCMILSFSFFSSMTLQRNEVILFSAMYQCYLWSQSKGDGRLRILNCSIYSWIVVVTSFVSFDWAVL